MRIAVFIDDNGRSGERFIQKVAELAGVETRMFRYEDVVVLISKGNVRIIDIEGVDILADIDLIYLRGITHDHVRHAIALCAKSKKIAVVNDESYYFQAMGKLDQGVMMALAGVPVADTVHIGRREYYDRACSLLGSDYPIIMKSHRGSNGRDNVLIGSIDEQERSDGIPIPIFQEYIPNRFDYRVIVAGDRVLLSYKRVRSAGNSEHKNNISQGAVREFCDLPDDLRRIAINAARSIRREFCGVDILPSEDGTRHVVLEANFNFGTPEFVDESLEKAYYKELGLYFQQLTEK